MSAPSSYEKVLCDCGRLIGYNNFKRHMRKCYKALMKLSKEGRPMYLLDERSAEQKRLAPIPQNARSPT